MTHVVTDACILCKYTDCVDVCPVDCFHEGPNTLVINPNECIAVSYTHLDVYKRQGWHAWEAALAAVWLHGKAADRLAQTNMGCIGITAGEIAPVARILLNELVSA